MFLYMGIYLKEDIAICPTKTVHLCKIHTMTSYWFVLRFFFKSTVSYSLLEQLGKYMLFYPDKTEPEFVTLALLGNNPIKTSMI